MLSEFKTPFHSETDYVCVRNVMIHLKFVSTGNLILCPHFSLLFLHQVTRYWDEPYIFFELIIFRQAPGIS